MEEEAEAEAGADSVSSISTISSGSDYDDEVVSSASSHLSPPPQKQIPSGGPLHDMSSLFHQLPFKRGLSKHYQGKSESFTSLAEVRSVEDLAKPEKPYNKRKRKSCKSHAVNVENPPNTKKPSNNSSSSSKPPRASPNNDNKKSSFSNPSALIA